MTSKEIINLITGGKVQTSDRIRYIYKITLTNPESSLFNHYYIGQRTTSNIDDRYTGSGVYVRNYFRKYGKDNTYKKEILAYAKDQEELNRLEAEYIGDLYDTDPLCLNMKAGGDHAPLSKESRKKLSETLKQRYEDPENRRKLIETTQSTDSIEKRKITLRKTLETTDARQRMSESRKKLFEDPAFKQKHLEWTFNEESNKKRAEKLRQAWTTEEYRAKMHTPEINQHISEAHKRRWADSEERAKQSIIMTECLKNPEIRKKLSESSKKCWENEEFRNKIIKQIKDRKFINNGKENKKVKTEELDEYISQGWVIGKLGCSPNIGLISITNGTQNKYIKEEELAEYISSGWRRGQHRIIKYINISEAQKAKISKQLKGRIYVNNGKENKCLKPEELDEYISNGWLKGRLPRKSKAQ